EEADLRALKFRRRDGVWRRGSCLASTVGNNTMNSDEEILILNYLKAFPEAFLASAEIAKKANPRLFREDPRWAFAALLKLTDEGPLEPDASGHYRYVDEAAKRKEAAEEFKKRLRKNAA